ncbi:haloacid dehalogenase type II [Lewinella sp. IMCC34183]|uniref:haloacid dehalogenase type II n=1 Tax=Lewinella sp. IMCC34183 TaxID=2248762 RepID=UPI000E261CAB|nr:haloacid dehalogenase type II [Lewinella sp. IMCC34183]
MSTPTLPVIFFDVNETLLDLQPVKDSVTTALGGRQELVPLWFATLLQYSLVATVGKNYQPFGKIAAAALQLVAKKNDLNLSEADARAAVRALRALPPHPEVPDALRRLKKAGYRLFTLTNSDPEALANQMGHAGLDDFFEDLLSVDAVRKFKPHHETYAWAASRVGHAPGDCLLVAAHGWDVAGAGWAGMQTAFVARSGQATYPLADAPGMTVPDLSALADALVAG